MTDNEEGYWEVDYLFITHIMEIPVQCMIDVSNKVEQFIALADNLSEYLNIAEEEYVHPLIETKNEGKCSNNA